MADREKVIKGLECCKKTDGSDCKNCPYTDENDCVEFMAMDALELLKKNEHKDKMYHALEDDWKRLKELLKVQQLDIEALKNTIQGMVEGQCIIAGSKQTKT